MRLNEEENVLRVAPIGGPSFVALVPSEDKLEAAFLDKRLSELANYRNIFIDAMIAKTRALEERERCSDTTSLADRQFWPSILRMAFRDGAMAIYHFSKVLETLGKAIRNVPSLHKMIDYAIIKAAGAKFRTQFPDPTGVRDAIAHAGQLYDTPETAGQNTFTGPFSHQYLQVPDGQKIIIRSGFLGHEFVATHKGKLRRYELTDRTALVLDQVTKEIFNALAAPYGGPQELLRAARDLVGPA
jgi:hypothetical protein